MTAATAAGGRRRRQYLVADARRQKYEPGFTDHHVYTWCKHIFSSSAWPMIDQWLVILPCQRSLSYPSNSVLPCVWSTSPCLSSCSFFLQSPIWGYISWPTSAPLSSNLPFEGIFLGPPPLLFPPISHSKVYVNTMSCVVRLLRPFSSQLSWCGLRPIFPP